MNSSMKRLLNIGALCLLLHISVVLAAKPGTSARVDALLKTMTLDEKIGQMTQVDYDAIKLNPSDIEKYALGSILWGGGSEPDNIKPQGWADICDSYQGFTQKTKMKIPLIFGIDAVHGHNNVDGAVIFPHNIGLGATRNPKIVEQIGHATAVEMQGTGIQWDFAPCVAVARNERWGRTYESFGEDPALAKELGAAFVKGMQGSRLSAKTSALACVKHFAGDGGTTNGKDQGNTEVDEATLRAIHLPGYVEGIKAGALSIMVSYSSWNGKKMHGNKYLMTDVLKKELGFRGFLVSDWAGIDQLDTASYKNAIMLSINAGLDMAMIPNAPKQKNNYVDFIAYMKELVAEGKIPVSRIDDAVRRILIVKNEMGLFEHPFRDKALLAKIGSKAHRAIGRDAVRQSLVVLKNEKNILPLSKKLKNVIVAGKGADDIGMQCGGWTISWQGKSGNVLSGGTTILQAIKHTVSKNTEVTYSADGSGATGADAAIVVVGEEPYAEMIGDRADLHLSKNDVDVIEKLKATGIPVVVVLLSGRPIIITDVIKDSHAFVAAWLPGTEGQGVADVLFGDYKPTGKLPHTWPKDMTQIPISAGDKKSEPLFPYGFGLSY
ncbi:MAG: glycoside hydrolase family 3 C-terminal domain-containing protein [Ignavibacteriales bacterium]|nr:glycoside hydrolase family 3 C-terminal domain-containing protein [Ignavibacteriales bacterium]